MARIKSLDSYVEYLTVQHSQDQEEIAAQLALALYPIWKMVQFRDLDSSTIIWSIAALALIRTAFLQSQRVTAVFMQNVRFASLPTDEPLHIAVPDVEKPRKVPAASFTMPEGVRPEIVVADDFDQNSVAHHLLHEANVEVKRQMPGPEEDLMDAALVRSSGSAVRDAMDGGRGVADNIGKRDRKILGWARVTDSDPCHFCAILASRGAVYGKGSFKDSNAKWTASKSAAKNLPEGFTNIARVHNNCRCSMRPVYSKSQEWDATSKYYKEAWKTISENTPKGESVVNKFRQWLKKNPAPISQLDIHQLQDDLSDRAEALVDAGFAEESPQVAWARRQFERLTA